MKLAVVVQRYGPAVYGGAERHARYLAEHFGPHVDVEVLTTCASSDTTWANDLVAGVETVNGVTVRRFRVSSGGSRPEYDRLTDRVFNETHSVADELAWLESMRPTSRELLRYLRKHGDSYDFCVFVGWQCGHTYYGARIVASRAILVPHADDGPSSRARIFADVLRDARGIVFDSPEERSLVQASAGKDVPNVVAGAGADVAANPQPGRFRHKRNIRGPFALYLGRADDEHCGELLALFDRYSRQHNSRLGLVLAGEGPLTLPSQSRVKAIGAVDEVEKCDAIAAAEALLVPSPSQMFSHAAVEAWALGRPVLANGASKGLRGQCVRSNGGLCYRDVDEFVGMLQALERNRWLNASLGKNGRQYVRDNYDWRVVGRKYQEIFAELQKNPTHRELSARAGWPARMRRNVPPAARVVRGAA